MSLRTIFAGPHPVFESQNESESVRILSHRHAALMKILDKVGSILSPCRHHQIPAVASRTASLLPVRLLPVRLLPVLLLPVRLWLVPR